MRFPVLRILCVLFCLLLISCKAIKIETGQTPEERTQSTQDQARQFKVRWSAEFEKASDLYKAQLLVSHLEQTEQWYHRLADTLMYHWRQGNNGRGEEVQPEEMRQLIENSLKPHDAMLIAWDDMIEYGLRRIKEQRYFETAFVTQLQQTIDKLYKVTSAVRYPTGGLADYDQRVRTSSQDFTDQLTWLKEEIAKRE